MWPWTGGKWVSFVEEHLEGTSAGLGSPSWDWPSDWEPSRYTVPLPRGLRTPPTLDVREWNGKMLSDLVKHSRLELPIGIFHCGDSAISIVHDWTSVVEILNYWLVRVIGVLLHCWIVGFDTRTVWKNDETNDNY